MSFQFNIKELVNHPDNIKPKFTEQEIYSKFAIVNMNEYQYCRNNLGCLHKWLRSHKAKYFDSRGGGKSRKSRRRNHRRQKTRRRR